MALKVVRLFHGSIGALFILLGVVGLTSEGFSNNLSKSFLNPTGFWLFLPGLFVGGALLMLALWKQNRKVYYVLGYLMIGIELTLLWHDGFLEALTGRVS